MVRSISKRMFAVLITAVIAIGLLPVSVIAAPLPQIKNVKLTGSTLTWDSDSNVYNYIVSATQGSKTNKGHAFVQNHVGSHDLDYRCGQGNFTSGSCTIELWGEDNNGTTVTQIWSTTYNYQQKLLRPAVVNYPSTIAVKRVSWASVDNAELYYVRLTDVTSNIVGDWVSTSDTGYVFDSIVEGHKYYIEVYATAEGYRQSDTYKSSEFGYVPAADIPNVVVNDNGITWGEYPLADGYKLKIGDITFNRGWQEGGRTVTQNFLINDYNFPEGDFSFFCGHILPLIRASQMYMKARST